MIALLFLSVLSLPSLAPLPVPLVQEAQDAEVDAKIAEAGTDVAKLLEVAAAFSAASKDDAAKKAYKKIVEVDPMHEAAHKALRHHFYDGKWFDSYAELSKYRREETAKMREKGLARWKDEWVAEADVPYLNMGWTKGDDGQWSNPVEVEQAKKIAEWKAAGHEFRADDCTWIAPEDKAKWTPDSWKCGDQWLNLEQANAYHSQIGQWWQLEGERFQVWTTCDWETGNWARWYGDLVYPDLVRLFGLQPAKKPVFIVLNSMDQFNKLAAGDQALQLPQSESEGFSSLHHAFFADILFDPSTTPPQFLGCGVGFWDRKDEKLAPWGKYSLRFAAAQSYCEAIDPSWLAISELLASISGGGQPAPGAFWAEKKIPRWLRYGAASYVERYAKDPEVGDGGNPWQIREWAFADLKARGGLRKLEDVFAFNLDLNDLDSSGRLYHEAGLVVSYLLDNPSKKLTEKHAAFKAALREGKDVPKAVEELQKELAEKEKDIKKFGDL